MYLGIIFYTTFFLNVSAFQINGTESHIECIEHFCYCLALACAEQIADVEDTRRGERQCHDW